MSVFKPQEREVVRCYFCEHYITLNVSGLSEMFRYEREINSQSAREVYHRSAFGQQTFHYIRFVARSFFARALFQRQAWRIAKSVHRRPRWHFRTQSLPPLNLLQDVSCIEVVAPTEL